MPVYEYRCADCLEHFEKLGAISDRDERVECPSCGERRAERLVSVFAAFSTSGGQTASLGGGCCGGSGGGCACRG